MNWQQFLDAGDQGLLEQIGLYNRDDCLSTKELAVWLRIVARKPRRTAP